MNVPPPSPYLQYQPYNDPNQYIIPNAAPGHTRGRFELAFSQIGGSVLTGALFGGTLGTVRGLNIVKDLPSYSVKRTQMLNSIVKGGTTSANAFGVVALVYSTVGVGLSFLREDDDINTISAATLTGLATAAVTNKHTTWQRTMMRTGIGAALGFGLSLLYCNTPLSAFRRED
uniref:Mitochondrial import inner membrane translocase subunit Tim23 n=1 Tax=Aceria tosichella TaxID=561515 RepID=A0A6G1SI08_9ACAR